METFHHDDQRLYDMLRNDIPIKIHIPADLIS
jgi:hypothetical protein